MVKLDHYSQWQVWGASTPIADCFNDAHCSVDEANFYPEVTGEHDSGRFGKADNSFQATSIIR